MKRNMVYKDDDGELEGIETAEFLSPEKIRMLGIPSPDELVAEPAVEKITIELEKKSLDFFRKEAVRRHGSYQRMIRNLLSQYVKAMTH